MSSFTVTSASAKARSVSALLPHSQCQMWLSFLSFLSVRSTGAPGSSALWGSTTTGSGSVPHPHPGPPVGGRVATGGEHRGHLLRLVHHLLDRQHHLGVRHEGRHPVQVVLGQR